MTSRCCLAFFAVCFSKGYAWCGFPPRLDKNQASASRSLFPMQLALLWFVQVRCWHKWGWWFFPSCQQILNQERRDYFPSLGLSLPWLQALLWGMMLKYTLFWDWIFQCWVPQWQEQRRHMLQHELMLLRFDSEIWLILRSTEFPWSTLHKLAWVPLRASVALWEVCSSFHNENHYPLTRC